MPWIRYDCAKMIDEWYMFDLVPAERNAFDLFLLNVKAHGGRGSVEITSTRVLAHDWNMDEAIVVSMMKKAAKVTKHGKGRIYEEDGRWHVLHWRKYQEDFRDKSSSP